MLKYNNSSGASFLGPSATSSSLILVTAVSYCFATKAASASLKRRNIPAGETVAAGTAGAAGGVWAPKRATEMIPKSENAQSAEIGLNFRGIRTSPSMERQLHRAVKPVCP